MTIAVFGEPLKVATSATPSRGMLVELIKKREKDKFILVFFSDPNNSEVLADFLDKIKIFRNWEIIVKPKNKIINYIKAFLGRSIYELNIAADVYLNPDCTSLGRKGHPLIVTVADFSVFKGRKFASFSNPISFLIRKAIVSQGISNADVIVAISQNTFIELNKLFKVDRKNSTVIYNGIDPSWFKYVKLKKKAEPLYWVWWGQISNRKNLPNILTAYSIIVKRRSLVPNFKIIYSNEFIPQEINDLIFNLGITNNVIFERRLGLLNLIEAVSGSEGLIFASKVEGFGVPIIEAMATGIPVLTSNVSSMPEVAGGNAILCNPADVSSIAQGIESLLDESPHSEDLVNKRKAWANNFTYQMAAEKFDELITKTFNRL